MGVTVQPIYSSASPVTCLPAPLRLAFLIPVPGWSCYLVERALNHERGGSWLVLLCALSSAGCVTSAMLLALSDQCPQLQNGNGNIHFACLP